MYLFETSVRITEESLQKIQKDTSFRTEDMTLLANFNKDIKEQTELEVFLNLSIFSKEVGQLTDELTYKNFAIIWK